ncbi:DUF350 domain-containing protein [candidate division KSB1 bacterium]|nr:DUF350 domain-containing protein [candidate division KSB1 bacterium]
MSSGDSFQLLILTELGYGLIYLVASFILFFIGKLLYQLVNRRIQVDEELVKKDNVAFAISMVGYYFGLIMAIGGALAGPSRGLLQDLLDFGSYGLLAIILMNLAIYINSKLILYRFSSEDEIIRDQNAGAGAIQFASYVATGLIIYGALSGEDGGLITALVFWILGQVVMVLAGQIYKWMIPYDIHAEIERDNVAAGVGFAGALLAIGNIIRIACSGDFISWDENLIKFGYIIIFGLILLPVTRLLTDKVLLPGEKLTDEIAHQEKPNLGAAFIEAFSYIGASFLIGWAI